MHYLEMMQTFHVTFMEGDRQVGRKLSFNDSEKLFDILRKCKAPVEDHQILEHALKQGRPGSVMIRVDEEQYARLAGNRVVK